MSERLRELYQKGKRLFEDKKWDETIAVCTEIIKLENDPKKKAKIYHNRGTAYSKKGDSDRAIKDYNKAIELNPQYAPTFNNRGNEYSKKGDPDRAIKDCDKAIELNPQYANAFTNRGNAYSNKGDLDCAIQDYNRAIELNPQDALTFTNRGNAYNNQGDSDRAIQDYNKAIELNPQDALTFNNRGSAYIDKGDPDRAIQDCDKAIELNPQYVDAFTNRGNAYSNKGDPDRAIQNYSKAIELNPQDALAFNNRGTAHNNKGDPDCAIKDYSKAIELNPQYALALNNRGLVYSLTKRYSSAFKDFVKAGIHDNELKSSSPYVYIASQLNKIPLGQESSVFYKLYIDLLTEIGAIKRELFYKPLAGEKIAHYTSLHSLKSFADHNPFRLYNVTYMNDPEEGQVFFEIMKDHTDIDIQDKFYTTDSEYSHFPPAHIGSFVKTDSRNNEEKDKLFLWRTYGKHDGEEATGACLIFNTELFAKEVPSLQIDAMPVAKGSEREKKELRQKLQPALYNVIYKQELGSKGVLSEKLKLLAEILTKIDELICSVSNEKDLILLAQEMLDGIRYLFKADYYKEEEEVRVVAMSYYADKEEQLDRKIDMKQTPPRFYLEMPDNVRFNEVIFGPKAGNLSKWQQWLTTSVGSVETSTNTPLTIKKSKIKFGEDFQ